MKPLTIDELKALPVGDWVWVTTADGKYGAYGRVCQKFDDDNFRVETIESYIVDPYETYGTKWLAYKNKEMAEAKGDIVELPCSVGDYVFLVDNNRHWAEIETIRIYNEHNGSRKIAFEWVQYDNSPELTEVWDDGEFDIYEIGKTVFVEGIHDDKIKELVDKENKKFAEWEEEDEHRLADLRGEKYAKS